MTTTPHAATGTGATGDAGGKLPAPPRSGSVRGLVVLGLGLVVVCLLSLAIGSRDIPLDRVFVQLFNPDGSTETTIVRELRVSRTALGLAVGACLGVAGALMQGHTRNPLADPGLLGVTAGAAFAVVLGIYVFSIDDPINYAWFSLVGAGVAATVVFIIGSTRGGPDPITLVLAGTAVTALLGALTQTVVLRDLDVLDDYRVWVVGSIDGPGLDVLAQVAPFMVLGLLLAGAGSPGLNLLQLGDDVARSLGMTPPAPQGRGHHRRDAAGGRGDRRVRSDQLRRPGRAPCRALLRRRRLPLGGAVRRA